MRSHSPLESDVVESTPPPYEDVDYYQGREYLEAPAPAATFSEFQYRPQVSQPNSAAEAPLIRSLAQEFSVADIDLNIRIERAYQGLLSLNHQVDDMEMTFLMIDVTDSASFLYLPETRPDPKDAENIDPKWLELDPRAAVNKTSVSFEIQLQLLKDEVEDLDPCGIDILAATGVRQTPAGDPEKYPDNQLPAPLPFDCFLGWKESFPGVTI